MLQGVPPPDNAIIVEVLDAPSTSIVDVIMAALGISGVLAVAALILGLILAVAFVIVRFRRRQASTDTTDHQRLNLSS